MRGVSTAGATAGYRQVANEDKTTHAGCKKKEEKRGEEMDFLPLITTKVQGAASQHSGSTGAHLETPCFTWPSAEGCVLLAVNTAEMLSIVF